MATTLRILSWSAEGLRCPNHTVTLGDESHIHKVSLIQMPNGVGKTTTLRLLRAALSGEASWSPDEVREFRKRTPRNRRGQFSVVLLTNQNRRLTIVMKFDFSNGEVSFQTSYGSSAGLSHYRPSNFSR